AARPRLGAPLQPPQRRDAPGRGVDRGGRPRKEDHVSTTGAGRTFVIGDVHGERTLLDALLASLPFIAPDDSLVFLGDYIDRGPDSRGVVEILRRLPEKTAGKVVLLRGNHEDALLGEMDTPSGAFVMP